MINQYNSSTHISKFIKILLYYWFSDFQRPSYIRVTPILNVPLNQEGEAPSIKTFSFTSFFHSDFETGNSVISVRTTDGNISTNISVKVEYYYRLTSNGSKLTGVAVVYIDSGSSEGTKTVPKVFGYLGSTILSITPSSYGNEDYTF